MGLCKIALTERLDTDRHFLDGFLTARRGDDDLFQSVCRVRGIRKTTAYGRSACRRSHICLSHVKGAGRAFLPLLLAYIASGGGRWWICRRRGFCCRGICRARSREHDRVLVQELLLNSCAGEQASQRLLDREVVLQRRCSTAGNKRRIKEDVGIGLASHRSKRIRKGLRRQIEVRRRLSQSEWHRTDQGDTD